MTEIQLNGAFKTVTRISCEIQTICKEQHKLFDVQNIYTVVNDKGVKIARKTIIKIADGGLDGN